MKIQIWIAVSVYVLVAIISKRLELDASLYQILQIFSVTVSRKRPFDGCFRREPSKQTYLQILALSKNSTKCQLARTWAFLSPSAV